MNVVELNLPFLQHVTLSWCSIEITGTNTTCVFFSGILCLRVARTSGISMLGWWVCWWSCPSRDPCWKVQHRGTSDWMTPHCYGCCSLMLSGFDLPKMAGLQCDLFDKVPKSLKIMAPLAISRQKNYPDLLQRTPLLFWFKRIWLSVIARVP